MGTKLDRFGKPRPRGNSHIRPSSTQIRGHYGYQFTVCCSLVMRGHRTYLAILSVVPSLIEHASFGTILSFLEEVHLQTLFGPEDVGQAVLQHITTKLLESACKLHQSCCQNPSIAINRTNGYIDMAISDAYTLMLACIKFEDGGRLKEILAIMLQPDYFAHYTTPTAQKNKLTYLIECHGKILQLQNLYDTTFDLGPILEQVPTRVLDIVLQGCTDVMEARVADFLVSSTLRENDMAGFNSK